MFDGALPPPVLALVREHVKDWPDQDLWVGCSGGFGVERALVDLKRPFHSNDVTLYSSTIGGFLAGHALDLQFSDEALAQFPWLNGCLGQSPEQDVAVVMECTRLVDGFENPNHKWYSRLAEGYERQWADLLEITTSRVADVAGGLQLASYDAEDVYSWLDQVPDGAPLIIDPPSEDHGGVGYHRGAGYVGQVGKLGRMFTWEAPEYQPLDADRLAEVIDRVIDREHWLLTTTVEHPKLDALGAQRGHWTRSTRAKSTWVYASGGPRRYATNELAQAPVMIPKLAPAAVLRPDAEVGLVEITGAQLNGLRSMYLDTGITPAKLTAGIACGVVVDGVLVGAFGISGESTYARSTGKFPQPAAYMLSDFPVAPTLHARLSKLVVACALSEEARLLFERKTHRRFNSVLTTAFTHRPVSMKYRGLMDLATRKDNPDGKPGYQLTYGSTMARWPIAQAYADWYTQHAHHLRGDPSA